MPYSAERKRLNNILCTENSIKDYKCEILTLMPELIICVECEQNMPEHIYNVFDHILETTDNVSNDLILKITSLLHDIGKPYVKITRNGIDNFKGHEEVSTILAELILLRLGYEQTFIKKVCTLIRHHDYHIQPTVSGIQEAVHRVGEELLPYLFCFQKADALAHAEQRCQARFPELTAAEEIYMHWSNKNSPV